MNLSEIPLRFTCATPSHFLHCCSSSPAVWKQDVHFLCGGSSIISHRSQLCYCSIQLWSAPVIFSFLFRWNRQPRMSKWLYTGPAHFPFVWTLSFPLLASICPYNSFRFHSNIKCEAYLLPLRRSSLPVKGADFVPTHSVKQLAGFQSWIFGAKCPLMRHTQSQYLNTSASILLCFDMLLGKISPPKQSIHYIIASAGGHISELSGDFQRENNDSPINCWLLTSVFPTGKISCCLSSPWN